MTTDTPIFMATQLDTGIDVQAILERPKFQDSEYDVDAAWQRIREHHGYQQLAEQQSTSKRTRTRRPRS